MMREVLIFLTAIILSMVSVYFIVTMDSTAGKNINCGVSEISPDFTNEMKEACRKARSISK
jgi:hypothetical protein